MAINREIDKVTIYTFEKLRWRMGKRRKAYVGETQKKSI